MDGARPQRSEKLPSLLALALPVLAGLGYLFAYGAPQSYLLINAGALAHGLVWVWLGPSISKLRSVRIVGATALLLLALPLATGPSIEGVARWVPLGPFQLHSGALAVPLLAGAAVLDRDYTPVWLLSAVFLAMVQPDAGALFAITGLSIGLYFAKPDWKPGVVAMAAFLAALYAHLRALLPPQPFVERVLAELILTNPLLAFALFLSLLASFFLILRNTEQPLEVRAALAGTIAGFSLAALMSSYPSVLIGYGAAPIIGLALAVGIRWRTQ